MLTNYQKAFVNNWKQLNFTDWNETDIREEFIAPLLRLLGYSKGTMNTIVREHQVKLTHPYHRIGRDKIIIDYVPSIKLRNFWIIEAKPGNSTPMNYGDLLQAHLYAIHPEVQVPYIVLCNGHEIRVYDSHTVSSWEDTICISNQNNAQDTFVKIVSVLSAISLLSFHRNRILNNIENVFQNEIDEREFRKFKSEVNITLRKLEGIVKANANDFRKKAFRQNEQQYFDELKSLDLKILMVHMDIPTNIGPQPSNELIRRIRESDEEQRSVIIKRVAMNCRGRPHTIFRVNALRIACACLDICPRIKGDMYFSTIPELINELAYGNITYSMDIPLHNALWHYDNICLRLSKKITMKTNLEKLSHYVKELRENLSAEDLLKDEPHLDKSVIQMSGLASEIFWRIASSKQEGQIWETIWILELIEKVVDTLPERKNPEYGGDFLWLEHYGIDYDMLITGSWAVLSRCKYLEGVEGIKPEVIEFSKMHRDAALAKIPRDKEPPHGWRPSEKALKNVFEVFFAHNL